MWKATVFFSDVRISFRKSLFPCRHRIPVLEYLMNVKMDASTIKTHLRHLACPMNSNIRDEYPAWTLISLLLSFFFEWLHVKQKTYIKTNGILEKFCSTFTRSIAEDRKLIFKSILLASLHTNLSDIFIEWKQLLVCLQIANASNCYKNMLSVSGKNNAGWFPENSLLASGNPYCKKQHES